MGRRTPRRATGAFRRLVAVRAEFVARPRLGSRQLQLCAMSMPWPVPRRADIELQSGEGRHRDLRLMPGMDNQSPESYTASTGRAGVPPHLLPLMNGSQNGSVSPEGSRPQSPSRAGMSPVMSPTASFHVASLMQASQAPYPPRPAPSFHSLPPAAGLPPTTGLRPTGVTQGPVNPTTGPFFTGGSSQTYSSGHPGAVQPFVNGHGQHGPKARALEDECVDELGAERCGDELRPPQSSNLGACGLDKRFLLPGVLVSSTVCGSVCVWLVQAPLLHEHLGVPDVVSMCTTLALYGLTLGLMAYCAFCDPGQLRSDQAAQHSAYLRVHECSPANSAIPQLRLTDQTTLLPRRAHKAWQYVFPIRRYDHYCRWVTNCIGLLNHREFVLMCTGLVVIAVAGLLLDVALVAVLWYQVGMDMLDAPKLKSATAPVLAHLAYSGILLFYAGPILKIHMGLVSRNELASEWKRNEFYVAVSAKRGIMVPANDLSDDEFNSLFESFSYDKSRNLWDRGCQTNCWNFWCTPRWRPDQLGEF